MTETSAAPITPHNHLQIASQLRLRLPPAQAQAVLEMSLLRQLAIAKFNRARKMFFTRPALEQASAEIVSHHRASRFARKGLQHVVDMGCSIGGDALALAAHANVTGIDWDPLRLAIAQENVRVYGHGDRFHPLQADLLELTPFPVDAFFFDPARRDEQGRRFYSVHQYQPPLGLIDRWLETVPNGAVKISPGVDYAEIPEAAEVEVISVNGEVKEALLWFGELRSGVKRRATLLPGGETITTAEMDVGEIPIKAPAAYLYEPDKAVIRAHLVEAVAAQLGASKIDEQIAYLTADSPQITPFARCFSVQAVFPFQLKRLRRYLREHDIGRVTIKKRGSPLEPDSLRQQLRLRGEKHRVIFLTQVMGEATVVVGQVFRGE